MSGTQIFRKFALPRAGIPLFVIIRTFLAFVGFAYFIAFSSFGTQATGLIGSHGILPCGAYLQAAREQLGSTAFRELPTILWLNSSDAALRIAWMAGAAASLVAIFTRWQRCALAVCLVLWVSLCIAGQDFLGFQWDILLSEAGFLSVFAGPSRLSVWLFRWLCFRLMFFSAVVKLASRDAAWRNLTALHFHYETQPLPTPAAWYFYQLPMWFHQASTLFVFAVELLVPFLFFAPRKFRYVAAAVTALLQLLILFTGNYTFFNLLTIGLLVWVTLEPDGSRPSPLLIAAAVFVAVASGLICLEQCGLPLPEPGVAVLRVVEPLRIVNSYGLFAVMTTERVEIEVEGSDDGTDWKAYAFRYKPGDVRRAPPIVEPDQPRLDWQMWFAALGSYQQNPWFTNFMIRLLEGEPAVLRLLAYNPFPHGPPKYVRARQYLYHFTTWGDKAWWTREDRGLYFPAVRAK